METVKKGLILFLSLVLVLSLFGLIISKSVVNVLSGDDLKNKIVSKSISELESQQNLTSLDNENFGPMLNQYCEKNEYMNIPMGDGGVESNVKLECSKLIGKNYSEVRRTMMESILKDMKESRYDCNSFSEGYQKYGGNYIISNQASEDIDRQFVKPAKIVFWILLLAVICILIGEFFLFEKSYNFFITNGIIGFLSSIVFSCPINFNAYLDSSMESKIMLNIFDYAFSVLRHNALYILIGSIVFIIVGVVLRVLQSSKNTKKK